jgi:hypothetical protein
MGVLQLGIGLYEFIGSLRNPEFQIVARFGEQLFCSAARGTKPVHQQTEYPIEDKEGFQWETWKKEMVPRQDAHPQTRE